MPPVTPPGPLPGRGSAVIVGASLAGLSLAISLARSGLRVTALERAAWDRQGGTGLRLWGGQGETVARRDGSGLRVPTIASIASAGVPGPEGWATVRQRLFEAASAEPGVRLLHGVEVTEVGQQDDVAWVRDGTGTRHEADVVLGADGHRSLVRRAVAPEHPHASYAGYTIWTGTVPYEVAPGRERGHDHWDMIGLPDGAGAMIVGETRTNGRRRGYFWQWYDPTGDDYLRAAGALRGTVVQHSLVAGQISDARYAEIRERSRHWPAPWDLIVRDSVRRRDVVATPIAEYVPRRLARGRLAIVGDAAHVPSPMTGAGYDTGLADAERLGELTRHGVRGERGPAVLRAYEEDRLRPVRRMVESGRAFGEHLLASTGRS